ncbi:hypothetical protein BLOT_015924 [Blomia tropicalis]|nr:hypothetical protein BLOT_015924 [Blomia tropicalis]
MIDQIAYFLSFLFDFVLLDPFVESEFNEANVCLAACAVPTDEYFPAEVEPPGLETAAATAAIADNEFSEFDELELPFELTPELAAAAAATAAAANAAEPFPGEPPPPLPAFTKLPVDECKLFI